MAQDNTTRPGGSPDADDASADQPSSAGSPDLPTSVTIATPPGALPVAARTSVALTPGQRLAAKQAQKAVDKREFKEELKRKEEETKQKEQVEADKFFGRPQADGGLPANVERAAGTFTEFLQANRGRIFAGIGALVVVAVIALGAQKLLRAGAAEQAAALGAALDIANAPIDAENKEGKTEDGKPVFKTADERANKALAAFAAVAKEGDEGAATWALLGQGASEIALGKFADAQKHFQDVADKHGDKPAIAARALEGVAIALEGAGKADEARATYEKLKAQPEAKQLAELHLARLALAKGDQEAGKSLLKSLYDELKTAGTDGAPSRYLRGEVELRLAEIDSSLVSRTGDPAVFDPSAFGDPSKMSQEQIKKLIESLKAGGGAPPAGAGSE